MFEGKQELKAKKLEERVGRALEQFRKLSPEEQRARAEKDIEELFGPVVPRTAVGNAFNDYP